MPPRPARYPAVVSKLRQPCCFLFAGGIAFAVDATTLLTLHHFGLSLLAARILSISLAMVVAWWLNRTLTFRQTIPPTWQEFIRYTALATGVATINYLLFTLLLVTGWIPHPLMATAAATLISMAISFAGMKTGVFRSRHP